MSDRPLVIKAIQKPGLAFRRTKRLVRNHLEDQLCRLAYQRETAPIVNQTEIRVVGLRRIGNHAIINWLRSQVEGEVWHLNNVEPGENPYRNKYQNLEEHFPEYQDAIQRYKGEYIGNFTPKALLVYNHEDCSLPKICHPRFEKNRDLYVGKSNVRQDVLILRDPFNWLASRFKSNMLSLRDRQKTLVDLWIEHAREFRGETNYLSSQKVCINYNRWTKNRAYRKHIAERLGLKFCDRGLNQVSGCGGGSSFDGLQHHGNPSKMKVRHRWKQFADDPHYRHLISNPQLWEYTFEIFGDDIEAGVLPDSPNALRSEGSR
ncbi:hypothetical protein [Baaleninema sp.]|uniref:hypothetical protein n=1 Tax=Baaleninema sp. TaxID=3101197 RepID=UPI003CFE787D